MIVKITDGKDIRRFTTSTTSITYSAIHKHAAEAMGQAAAGYGGADPSTDPDMEGVHPGAMCDKTGVKPIVGTRYHLKGHNYDLCAAEYNKLPDAEKAQFEAIEPIKFRPKAKSGGGAHAPTAKGFH